MTLQEKLFEPQNFSQFLKDQLRKNQQLLEKERRTLEDAPPQQRRLRSAAQCLRKPRGSDLGRFKPPALPENMTNTALMYIIKNYR